MDRDDPDSDAMIDFTQIDCPYCGETFDAAVDLSSGDMDYVEDCPVCCRPIEMRLRLDGDAGAGDVPAFTLLARADRD